MPTTPPPADDGFDDGFDDGPDFVNDRFDDPASPYAAAAADPFEPEPYATEPVLIVDEAQNVPNSYNVRNIVLLASGVTLLLFAALIWSLTRTPADSQAERERLAQQNALGQQTPATVPTDILQAQNGQEEELQNLLDTQNAPGITGANSYGGYTDTPAPQTSSSYYSEPTPTPATPTSTDDSPASATPAGPSAPTYYDRRREAYYAALGLGSRESIGTQPGFGQAGGAGQGDLFGLDAQGNLVQANGAGGQGAGGQGGQAGGGQAGGQAGGGQAGGPAGGGQGTRRTGPPSLPPNSSYRQASAQVSAPFAPFTLPQGTLIPVVLETAVNSELQGVFIARTVEDVYDRTRRHVLIPRGTQVVSSYANAQAIGDRLQAAANRLNLPDGRSVDFADTGVFDSQGRAGLRDRVNRHTASRLAAGALLTIVGVASAVGQRRAQRDVILVPNADGSVSQVPVGTDIQNEAVSRSTQGAADAISERATRIINRPNTIILRPGLRGTLILQQDVDMRRPYYNDGGSVPRGPSPFDTRRARPSPRPANR